MSKLKDVLGESPSNELFTAVTFPGKKIGSVGRSVKIAGIYRQVSCEAAAIILDHLAAFEAAAVLAVENSQRPGEYARLLKEKNGTAEKPVNAAAAKKSALSALLAE